MNEWWEEEATTTRIFYRRYRPYKYVLDRNLTLKSTVVGYPCSTEFIRLDEDGTLHIRKGYTSDGASGCTIDTKSSMRGAYGHDALYQLSRAGLIPIAARGLADNDIERWTCEDGMFGWRAKCWHFFLHLGGGPAANPQDENKYMEVMVAP